MWIDQGNLEIIRNSSWRDKLSEKNLKLTFLWIVMGYFLWNIMNPLLRCLLCLSTQWTLRIGKGLQGIKEGYEDFEICF